MLTNLSCVMFYDEQTRSLGELRTGWRIEKCGWQNEDGKTRMTTVECGWKIAIDTMQMTKSLWGKINFRCFLKVLFVNKPSHLTEFRPGEVQYFTFNQKQKNPMEGWENSRQLYKQKTSSRICITLENSPIAPRPRMFRWGYVNTEKVFYCSYNMILNTTSKAGESSGSGSARTIILTNKEA